jgi:hypothetical protein
MSVPLPGPAGRIRKPPTMSIPAKRYNEVVEALGWKVPDVATFFDVTVRTVFRWQAGTSPVPVPVAMLLELMVAGKASPEFLQKIIGRKATKKT